MSGGAELSGWVAWLTVIACGAVTLLSRASFIVLPESVKTPTWLQRGLKYVAAAVLPALIVPDVLFRDVPPDQLLNVNRIIAMALALLVAYRTRDVLMTLGAGLVALWVLQYFGG